MSLLGRNGAPGSKKKDLTCLTDFSSISLISQEMKTKEEEGDENRGRPRSSSLADPGPSWSRCIEAVPLEDGIAGIQERDTRPESGRTLFFVQGRD